MDVDVDVDVIVDVVVDCWLDACVREAGRLPLWIESLALSAHSRGAVPRGNSILLEQLCANESMRELVNVNVHVHGIRRACKCAQDVQLIP